MEVGGIARGIGKLFKRGREGESAPPALPLTPAAGEIKTPELNAYQADRQKAEERPLGYLLQKNREIVDRFAQVHNLKVVVWDGTFLLKKELEGGYTYQVVSLSESGDCISINVYKAGGPGPDDYLMPSLKELLEPIYKEGEGDHVLLINRDIESRAIAGEIIVDTRTRKSS